MGLYSNDVYYYRAVDRCRLSVVIHLFAVMECPPIYAFSLFGILGLKGRLAEKHAWDLVDETIKNRGVKCDVMVRLFLS